MPAVQSGPRHAAPRDRRTALLPGVLLAACGAAFAGLAALPAAAAPPHPDGDAEPALVPVELTLPDRTNAELYASLHTGLADAATPATKAPRPVAAATTAAARPPAARASRSRPTAAVVQPAAAFVRPGAGRLTSVYGRRWGRLHAGIDLAAGIGSPVRAVGAGTVQSAGTESGYGLAVRILHPDGSVTIYGHMSALLVSTGERVTAGTQIGREGNSGRSTGPHLHFEVRVDDNPINPIPWLRARGISA